MVKNNNYFNNDFNRHKDSTFSGEPLLSARSFGTSRMSSRGGIKQVKKPEWNNNAYEVELARIKKETIYEKFQQEKNQKHNKENLNSTMISGFSTLMKGTKSSHAKSILASKYSVGKFTPRNTTPENRWLVSKPTERQF
jgi:hypothetical protein